MEETSSDSSIEGTPRASPSSSRAPFPLRLKLALLSTLLAVIPLGVVGALVIKVFEKSVTSLSQEVQIAVVDDLARTISQELVEAQDGVDAVGRVLTSSQIAADTAIPLALSLVEGHEALDLVAIYGNDGQLVDVIREGNVENLRVLEELPEGVMGEAEHWNVATGRAFSHGGHSRVPLVIPLRAEGHITGYVMSPVSLEGVQNRVEQLAEAHFPNISNSLLIVDSQLRILAHTDRRRAMGLDQARREGLLQDLDSHRIGADHSSRSREFLAADGTPMVGSIASIPSRDWAVVVQTPQSFAYATLYHMNLLIWSTVLIAMILAIAVGFFAARRITAPLGKLALFAEQLADRCFDKKVEIATNDELSLLGKAMTKASADLAASESQLKEEAAIRADLGRYLPTELVEKVVRREQDMNLGGDRRTVTILFADVVAFTPLTEQLEPEDVVTILNELFTILTGIVFRHDGTVDKFVGDCVMALWGAPNAQEDHALRALAAAEDMMQWLELGNATWKERFGVTLHLAIGIHSGEAIVGNIGSKSRMEYTAIGTAVNIASHIESIARPQQILVTQTTRDAAGKGFEFIDAGIHTYQDSSEVLQLFEVLV